MKEIEISAKDKVEIVEQKQHEKKRVLVGSQKLKPNHRCFEINPETLEIKEAEYKHAATFNNGYKRSIDVKEGMVYILAMNKQNALKKFKSL